MDYYKEEEQLFNIGDELYAVTKDGPAKVVITDVEREGLYEISNLRKNKNVRQNS